MEVSQSIAECCYSLDALKQDTERDLVLPHADTTALAHLERRSPPWWGRQAELFQSKGLPHGLQRVTRITQMILEYMGIID